MLSGFKQLSLRANEEEELTNKPTILSLVPPVLPPTGGLVTVRYSGIAETEKICVHLNGEPAEFQKQDIGSVVVKVQPCTNLRQKKFKCGIGF
mmetsp:Transcript_5247/g.7681  ORF Transcript_5247/g.7681 Transcript_5247/m.7681 type:complete len:93 (-) Transcript_5247:70-348(-)